MMRTDLRAANVSLKHVRSIKTFNMTSLRDELTVVTAFFDIGTFKKGNELFARSAASYWEWVKTFAHLENPVVIYVDDNDADYERALAIRYSLKRLRKLTRVHRLRRREMWSFSLEPKIRRLFDQPGYPKHRPNTIDPSYAMAVRAKYEVERMAASENHFRSRYFCWADVRLLCDKPTACADVGSGRIKFYPPDDFRSDSLAVNQIDESSTEHGNLTARTIVYENLNWLGGGLLIGRVDVMDGFTSEYMSAVERMIDDGLMSADQQVLHALFKTMKHGRGCKSAMGGGGGTICETWRSKPIGRGWNASRM